MNLQPKPAVEVVVSRRRKILKIELCCTEKCKHRGKIRHKGMWFCKQHLPMEVRARMERAEMRRYLRDRALERQARYDSMKLHSQAVDTLTTIANMRPVSAAVMFAQLRLQGMGLPGPKPEQPTCA
jgi:hypothetical protein